MDAQHEANGSRGAAAAEPNAAERWRRHFAGLSPEDQERCKHLGPPKRSPEMQQYLDELLAEQRLKGGIRMVVGQIEVAPDEDEDAFWAALEEMS